MKMPGKRLPLPILQKVSRNLVKVSIFVSKMRRPIIPKLVLRKSNKLKRLKLIINKKETNYRFLQEYEFSAPSTPLIKFNATNNRSKLCFLVLLSRCFRGLGAGEVSRDLDCQFSVETLHTPVPEYYLEPPDLGGEEEDSVDERAEIFIRRFYQEMRRQRLEYSL